ncbi:MAG TPA: hypothetical protein PLU26_07125 [Candidatus Competibacter sp.]|nr:hypothetical protein [Candidatus Competibacteraceae bacterium]HUM94233.1 hypothetical protein [Candidatus Competibacter sp.]
MPIIVNASLMKEAKQFKNQFLTEMFGPIIQTAENNSPLLTSVVPLESNILGVGYGAKMTAGAVIDELAVRIYVRTKLPGRLIPQGNAIPPTVTNPSTGRELPTDVIPVGDLTALWPRPVSCGVSIGHKAVTAGTLGCLVRSNDPQTRDHYILSNNHVLANSSPLASGTVPPGGDEILEPGPLDGGEPHPPIAELTDWEPINFSGINVMDAAIARVFKGDDVFPNILVIGSVAAGVSPPKLYQSVRKHGRTTLHTVGVIMDLSANIKVRYGNNLVTFDNQLGIVGAGGTFSSGGDSGSLIVDGVTRKPVALLFAGGGGMTFASPINPILKRFNVKIM